MKEKNIIIQNIMKSVYIYELTAYLYKNSDIEGKILRLSNSFKNNRVRENKTTNTKL